LGVFKPGALHKNLRIHGSTVLLAPIKALPCLCILPPMAEKSKPPALRMVSDSNRQHSFNPALFKDLLKKFG
jgi:hypothetical protein